MNEIRVGDYVSLKKGLKIGCGSEGIVMLPDMKFNGKMEVTDVYESGTIELENNYLYSPQMLKKEN